MFPATEHVRARLRVALAERAEQGYDTAGLDLDAVPDSLDALAGFAERIAAAPLRADWPYVEPDDLHEILAECDPGRARELGALDPQRARAIAESAWLTRVAGCMLGKPFEIDPTMDELRAALEPEGRWPLDDYPTEAVIDRLRERQGQWDELVAERLDHVVPDDDLNYTILAMLLLEQHGLDWTRDDLLALWALNLPVRATFGPERTLLARAATAMLEPGAPIDVGAWAREVQPGSELCGALIRVDAYAYASLGRPARAAELAWRDASCTHNKTGVYASMFVAAAIAAAPFGTGLDAFRIALGHIPQRSRFADGARACLAEVEAAADLEDGYRRIVALFPGRTHCRIWQEVGTLMNTMRFATDPGHGICLQVMQGNDTDSFGATAGSLLGATFEPRALDARWLAPLGDDLRTALALFHERSLAAVTARMGGLAGQFV